MRYPRRTSSRLCLVLLVTSALAVGAWAEAVSVAATGPWFVSPAGNDANDCQTYSTACRTISAAVGKASAGDILIVAAGTYTESVTLDKNLTLIGFGSEATIMSGGGISFALQIPVGVSVNLSDMAFVRGYYYSGIVNDGSLTLTNSVVAYNLTGGIYNRGLLTVNHSSIHDNQTWDGGGIYNAQGVVGLNDSTVISNSVHFAGGGVVNLDGNLSVNNSVIANNLACNQSCPFTAVRLPSTARPDTGYSSEGAGIFSSGGVLTVTNSTISDNTTLNGDGGGLVVISQATLANTTVSGNIASYAAGIRNALVMTLTNVTLADNLDNNLGSTWARNTTFAGGGCSHNPVISLGHNLSSDGSCGLNATGDLTNTNPLLGPLADNGGPTPTHALLPGSPAINAGDNHGCPATDQRGIARPQAGICDIGSVEFVFPHAQFLPVILR